MVPPTSSTSNVAPISSGATSWTLRAKKSRVSIGAPVVAKKRGERRREQETPCHTGDAARDDREPQAGNRRGGSGFEIPDRRGGCNLHEFDSRDSPQHLLGRDPVEHHRAQDGAVVNADAGERKEKEPHQELLDEPERRDRQSPEGGRDYDAMPLEPHMSQ